PKIIDISRAGTPASQASRGGTASRRRCLRRQLTQMLKEGSECFNPDDVRRIIRAARSAHCHLHAGRRHIVVHACLPGR
ncbi:MAG: hypothetical protein ACK56F_28260, partial [bacterium]